MTIPPTEMIKKMPTTNAIRTASGIPVEIGTPRSSRISSIRRLRDDEKAKGRTDRFDAPDGHEDEQQLGDVVLERVLAPLVLRLNDRRQEHDDAEVQSQRLLDRCL